MKKYYAVLLSALLSSPYALADTPAPNKNLLAKIEKKTHQERLMASHLSKKLVNSFHAGTPLSYATGHEFYDTPVELVDDEGNIIDRRYQYNSKKHYKLANLGSITKSLNFIWFVSPNGTNPEELNDEMCTFENPCQQLTQPIVEFTHQFSPKRNEFWFATGVYNLPVTSQKKHQPKLIELHDEDRVVGRTSDFLHDPLADERPLLIGSLAWIDYTHHWGGFGSVSSIKIKTDDKSTSEDMYPNIYTTGSIAIYSTDLLNDISSEHGVNIYAKLQVFAFDSNLNVHGDWSTNIRSEYSVLVEDSSLTASGTSTRNIQCYDRYDGFVSISKSALSIKNNSDYYYAYVLDIGVVRTELESTTINVQSTGEPTFFVINNLNRLGTSLNITNTIINVMAENEVKVIEYEAPYIDIYLSNSQIKVNSQRNSLMFNLFDLHRKESKQATINFSGAPSLLSVSSPISAEIFPSEYSLPNIINSSTPASQCVINGQSQDC